MLLALSALLVSAACGSRNLRPDERPKAGQAVAFFVVRTTGPHKARFHFFPGDSFSYHSAYIDAGEGTAVYALPLAPGAFRLREISLAFINARMTKSEPCARPFKVAAGRSSYGGTLDFNAPEWGKNTLSCDIDFGAYDQARTMYEAAFPDLARAFPPAPGASP